MKKIAFVIPWYGPDIPGGAESACRGITNNLLEKGMEVEILTTCVEKFNSDWNRNFYPEGTDCVGGIPTRRFPVNRRDTGAFDRVNYKLIHNMPITLEEEKCFFKEMINSEKLYEYIRKNQQEYQCFIFLPYMFGTTFYGAQICPEKTLMIPCFHDEAYAYMKLLKPVVENCRGLVFLAKPEKDLAEKLFDIEKTAKAVIGTGIDIVSNYNPDEFRNKYKISREYLLYAGRKDKGKNIDELMEFFIRYKSESNDDLMLVLIGGGEIDIPPRFRKDILDLGFVSIEDKHNAYAAALMTCQPSLNESFSIVIMESWASGRPVIVHDCCEVTKKFCKMSNGGLYYRDYEEFRECVRFLKQNQAVARKMGEQGKRFVRKNFTWEVVTERYITFIKHLTE